MCFWGTHLSSQIVLSVCGDNLQKLKENRQQMSTRGENVLNSNCRMQYVELILITIRYKLWGWNIIIACIKVECDACKSPFTLLLI